MSGSFYDKKKYLLFILRSYWKQFKVEILNIKGEKDVLR
jgi:hypothetical protein